jgi:2-dehydropantoate 2-reductase
MRISVNINIVRQEFNSVRKCMKIAIVGIGGIGGYYASEFIKQGHEVTLISRPQTLQELKRFGLNVKCEESQRHYKEGQDFQLKRIDTLETDMFQLILLCVKTYDIPDILDSLRNIPKDTLVLHLQNGINTYEQLSTVLPADQLLPGVTYVEAEKLSPGEYKQSGDVVKILYGYKGSRLIKAVRDLETSISNNSVECKYTDTIDLELWIKFIFIASVGGITALAGLPIKSIFNEFQGYQVINDCIDEILEVGKATGIPMTSVIKQDTLRFIKDNLEDIQASMHTDKIKKNRLELDALNGFVCDLAGKYQIKTPINQLITMGLTDFKNGAS